MVIAMSQENSLSDLQEKLLFTLKKNTIVTLDFSGMLNIEEDFLRDLFSVYPKSVNFLEKVRIKNANSVIVHSLKMVVNSVERKKK